MVTNLKTLNNCAGFFTEDELDLPAARRYLANGQYTRDLEVLRSLRLPQRLNDKALRFLTARVKRHRAVLKRQAAASSH